MLLAADVLSDLETQAVDIVAAQVAADHVDLQGSAALAGDVNGDGLLQPIDVLLIINAVSADGQMALMSGDPMDVNFDGWLTLDDASLAMAHLAATMSTPSGSPQPTVEPQPYDYDWSDPLNTFASSASSSMEPSASPSFSFIPSPSYEPTPTPSPTSIPSSSPSYEPNPSPTYVPSPSPSYELTPSPTYVPSPSPSYEPTPSPTYGLIDPELLSEIREGSVPPILRYSTIQCHLPGEEMQSRAMAEREMMRRLILGDEVNLSHRNGLQPPHDPRRQLSPFLDELDEPVRVFTGRDSWYYSLIDLFAPAPPTRAEMLHDRNRGPLPVLDLPSPPEGMTIRGAPGDTFRIENELAAGTFFGPYGTGPCVGVLIVPNDGSSGEYRAYHFSAVSRPRPTLAPLWGRTMNHTAYICGAEFNTNPTNDRATRLILQEVLAAITCVRGMDLGGYYPGGQILVGPDGTIYGNTPHTTIKDPQ